MVWTYVLYIGVGIFCAWLVNQDAKKTLTATRLFHSKKTNKLHIDLLLVFLLLLVLGTLRDVSVGTDTAGYFTEFNWFPDSMDSFLAMKYRPNEPLFGLLIFFCLQVNKSPQFIFFVVSFILSLSIVLFFATFVQKPRKYWFIYSIFILDYVYAFSAMRSGLATAFILLSFCAWKQKKNKLGIALSIVGILFHNTAIIQLVFYLIMHFLDKIQKRHKRIIVNFGIVLSLLLTNSLLKFVFSFISFGKYTEYFEQTGGVLGHIPMILLCIMAVHMYEQQKEDSDSAKGAYMSLLLTPSVAILNISRVLKYYTLARLDAYALCLEEFERHKMAERSRVWFRLICFAVVVAWMIIRLYLDNAGIIPYVLFDK